MDNQEQQKETTSVNQTVENKQDTTSNNVGIDIDNDKMWAIISYFIFFLPLLLVKNRSAFLKFHINQGLSLLIVALAGNIIFDFFLVRMGFVLEQIWQLLMLVLLVIGIKNASKKEIKPLPIIGKLFNIIK